MALNDTSKTQISIKKLVGKAHTSNSKGVANESLPTGITLASSTIFLQGIPTTTGSVAHYEVLDNSLGEGVVEFLRLSASFIPGSDTTDGRHGFELKLPDDYESNSTNPLRGVYPFNNQQSINITSGSLQLIPPSFSTAYEAKAYHSSGGQTQIPVLDARDWNLDYFNGIFFQQDPPGTGAHENNPKYIDAYLYIGNYLDSGNFSSGISGSLTQLSNGASYLVAGDNITISSGSNGQITISSTATSSGGSGGGTKSKKAYTVTDSISSGSSFTTTNSSYDDAGHDPSLIDVFLNGQLLLSGTNTEVSAGSVDYFVSDSNKLKFGFDLNIADIVNVVVENSGSGGETGNPGGLNTQVQFNDGGSLAGDSGLVFSKTTNTLLTSNLSGSLTRLSDGSSFIKSSTGINVVSASNGSISIKVNKEMVFNELLGGTINGLNTLFTLANTPFASSEISIFVNGQLQTPQNLTTYHDYSVTGSNVYFTTGSVPAQGSLLLAMYNKVVP